jgi:VanZ family protein
MKWTARHRATALAGWAAFLLFVSVIPGKDLPSISLWEADKLFHALFYALLTLLAHSWLRLRFPSAGRLRIAILSSLLCILYGFFIELIQLALPSRACDMYDGLANAAGCILAALLLLVTGKGEA